MMPQATTCRYHEMWNEPKWTCNVDAEAPLGVSLTKEMGCGCWFLPPDRWTHAGAALLHGAACVQMLTWGWRLHRLFQSQPSRRQWFLKHSVHETWGIVLKGQSLGPALGGSGRFPHRPRPDPAAAGQDGD